MKRVQKSLGAAANDRFGELFEGLMSEIAVSASRAR
jgi:hypothetical protein